MKPESNEARFLLVNIGFVKRTDTDMMNYYLITFFRNRVLRCRKTEEWLHTPFCEHENGKVKYAVVKAESPSEARASARVLVADLFSKPVNANGILQNMLSPFQHQSLPPLALNR